MTHYLKESTAPSTPSSGQVALYAKTDGKLYQKDSTGVESELGAGGVDVTSNLYMKMKYMGNIYTGMAYFSDLIFMNGTQRTTDGGLTFSTIANVQDIIMSSGVNAFTILGTGSSPRYSTDSGATFTASTTGLTGVTSVKCFSMVNSNILIAGTASTGKGLWYSTDGGNNFVEANTGLPNRPFYVCGLHSDGVTGFAVTYKSADPSTCEIIKTTDGGVNWTNTGNTIYSFQGDIYLDTTDSFYYINKGGASAVFGHYNNTTGTNTVLYGVLAVRDVRTSVTKIFKASDNCYYFIVRYTNSDTTHGGVATDVLIKYDGTNIYKRDIGPLDYFNYHIQFSNYTAECLYNSIIEINGELISPEPLSIKYTKI